MQVSFPEQQTPLQQGCEPLHWLSSQHSTHRPPQQCSDCAHATPQLPQLRSSVSRSLQPQPDGSSASVQNEPAAQTS
jgi:hypothetical protein